MAQTRPHVSLSSALLARKGEARPAMRPQILAGLAAAPIDDLGWNDMGRDAEPDAPAVPPVLVERAVLTQQIERVPASAPEPAPTAVRPVSLATAARIGRDTAKRTAKSGKAAFTLRLDGDRHLRLRLASAVTNRSSQMLVGAALDAFLQSLPEVETLVAQLPATGPKR